MQEQHCGDWLAALATPYPAGPVLPPIQGAEQASLRLPLVSCSTMLSTHLSPSSAGGKVVAKPPKGASPLSGRAIMMV